MNQPCKTDQRAADRLLKKAVAIARADLQIARSQRQPDAYYRVFEKNIQRFTEAIYGAELHLQPVPAKPVTEEETVAC